MPLALLCGIPCSGKTRRAKELAEYFECHSQGVTVHLLADDLTTSKDKCYTDSVQEKTIRARLKSSVERYLTPNSVVILDSLNYIKGFRYELYCISKHLQTPYCVILCETPVDTAREWNLARQPSECYSSRVLDALVMRFETPDSRNRWDQPLFVLYPDDPLPCEDITAALFHRKPPPPNQSTQTQPLSETSFLHELDRLTQEVVRTLVDIQQTGVPGEHVTVPGSQEKVELARPVTMAELRRIRKQFISYTKLHPVNDYSKITSSFVHYLNSTIT